MGALEAHYISNMREVFLLLVIALAVVYAGGKFNFHAYSMRISVDKI